MQEQAKYQQLKPEDRMTIASMTQRADCWRQNKPCRGPPIKSGPPIYSTRGSSTPPREQIAHVAQMARIRSQCFQALNEVRYYEQVIAIGRIWFSTQLLSQGTSLSPSYRVLELQSADWIRVREIRSVLSQQPQAWQDDEVQAWLLHAEAAELHANVDHRGP